MTYSNPEDFEPDLDDLSRVDIAERVDHPEWLATVEALDEWAHRAHGMMSSHHNAGLFLELLAERGFEVVAKPEMPPLSELLPPATD